MFEPTSTLPNFTLGKFSMVRKAIVNGGAIRPVGLLLSLNPKYEKNNTFFHIWGVLGGALRRTQENENLRALRPHNIADKFITREKNNHQFFIYGPQCDKMHILGYSGGPGWPINNPTGPILLPRHPLTYINLHIKYGSNPIRIF